MRDKGETNIEIENLDLGQGHFDVIDYSDGNLLVSGWMLNPEIDFNSFAIYIDHCKYQLCTTIKREDVGKAFPDIPHANNTGFSFSLDISIDRMNKNLDICVIGLSQDKEIAKIRTYYNQIQNKLVPPEKLILRIGGGFENVGNEFLRYFIDIGNIKPNAKILDVGCGCGRMAVPLIGYLDERGSYDGFDIIPEGIIWCQENITKIFPKFKFQLADVYNKEYNPSGAIDASKYTFPYNDDSFDFVFLTSVFTHMLPQEIENYFSEITRVLKKDGICMSTFFLLNRESLELINSKSSSLDFKYGPGKYLTVSKDNPESAIAYDELYVRGIYDIYNLNIIGPIYYGGWCGRNKYLSYQDCIIAKR